MRRKFLFFCICSLITLACSNQPAFAENILELNIIQPSSLSERKSTWPDWRFPSELKRPSFKDDLIYPDWFEGVWDVDSKSEDVEGEEAILHSARFIKNSSGKLIADREFNTESFAMNSNNSEFLSVKNDPNSPNRQFAKLTKDRFLETKIIGRLQETINNNIFITDELILQILHTPDFSRVSQVETLTEFKKCGSDGITSTKSENFNICGEQFQAIYKAPGQNIISLPIKTQKLNLLLSKVKHR
tara:strand:- start:593 stop:1327 length:735 start_codon:yes stop_codon:yes gene_type:complete